MNEVRAEAEQADAAQGSRYPPGMDSLMFTDTPELQWTVSRMWYLTSYTSKYWMSKLYVNNMKSARNFPSYRYSTKKWSWVYSACSWSNNNIIQFPTAYTVGSIWAAHGSFRCRRKQNRKGNLGRLVYNLYIAIPNVDDEYAKTQYDLTNARKSEWYSVTANTSRLTTHVLFCAEIISLTLLRLQFCSIFWEIYCERVVT